MNRFSMVMLLEGSPLAIVTATFAAYRAVELSYTLENCFVSAYAYGQAAYCSLIAGEPERAKTVCQV